MNKVYRVIRETTVLTVIVHPIEVKSHSFVRSFVQWVRKCCRLPCTYQVYTISYILRLINSVCYINRVVSRFNKCLSFFVFWINARVLSGDVRLRYIPGNNLNNFPIHDLHWAHLKAAKMHWLLCLTIKITPKACCKKPLKASTKQSFSTKTCSKLHILLDKKIFNIQKGTGFPGLWHFEILLKKSLYFLYD